MKEDDLQKINTLMLCDIVEALNIHSGYNTELIRAAVSLDHLWAIEIAHPGHVENADIPEEVSFIHDILHLFNVLKKSFNQFNKNEKQYIKKVLPDFSFRYDLIFYGFDPVTEGNMVNIASLLVLLGEYPADDLMKSSATPSVGRYTQMLDVFNGSHCETPESAPLSPARFCEIIQAGRVDDGFRKLLTRRNAVLPPESTTRH